MDELLKLLNDASIFYIATVDGDKARVRPFGFAMRFEGKLYFCTSNQKNIYKQLKANSNFEACAMISDNEWIRVSGKAIFDGNVNAKKQAFIVMPSLSEIYQSAEDSTFEVFYLSDGEATIYSMIAPPKNIIL